MSATETAIQTINWALAGSGPPPRGDLWNPKALLATATTPALREALQKLAVVTAAKLDFGIVSSKNPESLGTGGALLAAALGALHILEDAQALLGAIDHQDCSPPELAVRHALVAKVLPFLPGKQSDVLGHFRGECLKKSPLTAVLTRPLPSQENEMIAFIYKLLSSSAGLRFLQLAWAAPVSDPDIRNWRIEMLSHLRQTEEDHHVAFVIDVYEAHLIYYEKETLEEIKKARAVILNPLAARDDAKLQEALSIARWWRPLWEVRRSRNDELRKRIYLGYEYLKGLELCSLARQFTGDML
ncbi:MAG: hypothetical protein GY862_12465 [Gammaproteobacteria bacterium]|nr:hypothetical protein [Gammaproteobacteria bacterium]